MIGHSAASHFSKSLDHTNPFSTRAVRPGALEYQFPPDDSLASLVGRLRDNDWWGEIVGPHGSGKSTLIQSLQPALAAAGRQVQLFTLVQGQRRLSVDAQELSAWDQQTQLIVDGFEQLGWWQRRSLRRACRRRGCGLLITAHASFGLPRILVTNTSLELTQRLVSELLPRHAADRIASAEIADAFSRHAGNVREVFFDLYDCYQQRLRR